MFLSFPLNQYGKLHFQIGKFFLAVLPGLNDTFQSSKGSDSPAIVRINYLLEMLEILLTEMLSYYDVSVGFKLLPRP